MKNLVLKGLLIIVVICIIVFGLVACAPPPLAENYNLSTNNTEISDYKTRRVESVILQGDYFANVVRITDDNGVICYLSANGISCLNMRKQ
jgi:hypothetical protein